MACCISMLAALQIGNLSTTSSVVNRTTVSACYSDNINCLESSMEYHNYSKQTGGASYTAETFVPAFNKLFQEMYSGTQIRNKIDSKRCNQDISCIRILNYAQVGNGFSHLLSLTSSKLYASTKYVKPLHEDIETEIYRKTGKYVADDAEIQEGFNCIIDFPDKIS